MSFLPKGLNGRLILLLVITLSITQITTMVVFRTSHVDNAKNFISKKFSERIVILTNALEKAEPTDQGDLINLASDVLMQYTINDHPLLTDSYNQSEEWLANNFVQARSPNIYSFYVYCHWAGVFCDEDEQLSDQVMNFFPWPPETYQLIPFIQTQAAVSVKLSDGRWLNAALFTPPHPKVWSDTVIYSLTIMALVVIVGVSFGTRRISAPLEALSEAAEQLGKGQKLPDLPVAGSLETQQTIIAFNRMQDRLSRFNEDRVNMLAALSHDLRTPITSLRLRLELMEDSEDKQKMLSTLEDMQAMSEATLDYVRESGQAETKSNVDISALLESVCDDLSDLGLPVELTAEDKVIAFCRTASLKRAIRNVIENAVRYGEKADVSLTKDDAFYTITIRDNGPGIPPELMDKVFKPFSRLEQSRNRNSGGIGLGLAIARDVIQNHGGQIYLDNCQPSGLKVTIEIPL